MKRIPSGFDSAVLKQGEWAEVNKITKLSDIKLALNQQAVRSKNLSKVSSAVRVRSDQPTVLIGAMMDTTVKGNKGDKGKGTNSVARIDSSAPTALIAPDDYQHIFKGNVRKKVGVSGGRGTQMTYPSDAPTALIAPDDYEHIYKGDTSNSKQNLFKKKGPKVGNEFSVPSEAPTALIAPSDYQHIFTDAAKGGPGKANNNQAITRTNGGGGGEAVAKGSKAKQDLNYNKPNLANIYSFNDREHDKDNSRQSHHKNPGSSVGNSELQHKQKSKKLYENEEGKGGCMCCVVM